MADTVGSLEANGRSTNRPSLEDCPQILAQPSANTSIRHQTFKFNDWTVTITKGPILNSQCTRSNDSISSLSSSETKPEDDARHLHECGFCRNDAVLKLKHPPDMVFADNRVRIENTPGKFGIEFNALDAVNSIGNQPSTNVKVASAGVWQQSRSEALKLYGLNTVQYDWTYSPNYYGTLFGGMRAEETTEALDMEMLKRKDPVLLFEEVQLYGDELDDNGCAELDVKIRIVNAYIFVLMRFYLRVDHVFVRLIDTRLILESGKNYCLRECSVRERKIPELPHGVSPMDATEIWSILHPERVVLERILPPSDTIYY